MANHFKIANLLGFVFKVQLYPLCVLFLQGLRGLRRTQITRIQVLCITYYN